MAVSRRQPKVTDWQDINKSSTGLRTIAARLRRSETELNELGETVTTAKYQQMVDMLTKHSVSLVDENGELRDTYSIIQDIAAAWGDMSKNEQAALTEMAAGTRQQNVFTSLILNFKEAQNAMSAMESSTGSLTTAYDVYLESIQAHTGMFKAAFQELAQSLFESGTITGAIDLGTKVVESLRPIASGIANITDAVGGLNGALSILAGAIVIKNLTKIIGTIHNVITGTKHLGEVVSGLVSSLSIVSKSEFGPDKLIMSGGAVAGIGAAIAAMAAYVAYVQRWKAAQEELRTATYDDAKAESNRLDTFEKIRDRYEELSAMAEAGTLGEEGYREIASLQSQIEANQGSINSLIGTQAGQVDLVNGKYQEQIALLNQIVGEQAKEAADSAQRASDLALTDYINAYDDSSALNDDSVLRTINGRIDYISEHLNRDVDWSFLSPSGEEIDFTGDFTGWLKSGTKNAGELSEALKTIYDDLANNNDWQDLVDKRYGANYHVQLLSDIWSEYEIYNNKVKDVKNSVSELSEALLAQESNGKRATEPFEDFASYNEYRNQLAGKLLEDQRVIGALREGVIDTSYLASQIDSTLASIAPDMFKKYREAIGSGTETTMKEIVNTMPSMVGKSGMLTGVEDVSENITKLYGWLDKINSGDFDTKDLFDMLEEFPTLQEAADGVENLSTDLWKLSDAVKGAIDAAPADMIKRIDDYMGSHILSDSVRSQMETWKEYLRGMTDLTNVSMPERVSKLKEMQSAIYEAVGDTSGVTLDQYNNLIKINGEFADAIELDGDRVVVNTEKAMSIVRKMGVEYIDTINAQIDADTKRIATLDAIEKARGELTSSEAAERASLEQNIQKYQALRGEILNTLSAYEQWSAAQGTANAGSEVDELRAAWEHLNKVTKGGKDKDALYGQIYTDDTRAALALLGKDLEDFTTNGIFDENAAQKWLSGLNTYLNKGKQGVDDFLLDLRDAGLATYDNGIFQLAEDFELSDAARALDMSEEMVRAMLDFSTRYHDLDFSYILDGYEKEAEAIEGVTAAEEAESKAQASRDKLEAVEKENAGITDLLNLYDQLRQAESQRAQAQDMGAEGLVDSMDQQIQTIKDNISTVLSEPIDMTSIDSVREAINNTIQALNEEMETKKALGIEFDEEAIKSQIDNLTQDLSDIEAVVDISTTQQADADAGALETTAALLDSLKAKIDEISDSDTKPSVDTSSIENAINVATELGTALAEATVDRVVNVSTNFAGSVKDFWEKGKIKVGGNAGAQGGAFANGGNTLVGELGQEMVVDPENKYWYTVGDNGPEFIKLPKHAIVFNHKQTKSLLSRGKTNDRGTALASGTALAVASGAGGAQKKLEDAVSGLIGAAVKAIGGGTADLKRVNPKSKSKGSGGGGGGGSGSSSGSSKKSSDKDNWFIKQYKENNHLVKMDKKEQKDYLNWLDVAYKKAYKQGIIDLDDYRKYAEEVYDGLKDLFLDSIDDTQSKIDEMMNYDGAGKQIVNYYNQIINSVQKELKAAYARGLDDNDDYVQELKSQYWEYANALKEFEEGIVDDAKDATEELIRYRMKMITKELNDEKDNLQERLKSMKDFYDEQKKLLHESADNEDYLKEQAEKRKKITDLEIQLSQLSLDNSVKAQRKRLELEEELVKARDELYTFERDHTIGIIEDEYDKMYDTAEKATDAQIEDIDEKLEDQKYLYQTALEDLRNNNLALYNEMIAYNEHYIDGTGDALVDMWERAYEALYEYSKLYGKTFEGIELGNFTNWQPTTANTGTLTINGRKYGRGTSNAKAGMHQVDEVGPEQVFVTASGNRYRLFHGGEKVLNAKATQFLYDFANSGGSIISDALRKSAEAIGNMSRAAASIGTVAMGDIIIQGNATEKTVSEIRRSQRESVDYLLKEFKRLGK